MNIAIFGGSFNPVHKGHIEIVRQLLLQKKVSRVIIIPAYQNPLKTEPPLLPNPLRWEMLQAAFVQLTQVELSDFELSRPQPSYTYQTLLHFQQRYPQDQLYLVLGEDAFQTLPQWTRVDEILRLSRILVFPRPSQRKTGSEDSVNPAYAGRVEWLDAVIPDISASVIRQHGIDQLESSGWLPPEVLALWRRYHLTLSKSLPMQTDRLIPMIHQVITQMKAHHPIQFDLSAHSALTDFVLICDGTSTVHVRGIADQLVMTLKKQGFLPRGIEGHEQGQWILLDYGEIVIHLFLEATRQYYRLEEIFQGYPSLQLE